MGPQNNKLPYILSLIKKIKFHLQATNNHHDNS